MSPKIQIEVSVDSVASAIAAERGGADRVELCSDLREGGITPSAGLIQSVRSAVRIGVYVMIRPRAGDFCYAESEFETMRRDVEVAKRIGADGVVLGILNADGSVNPGLTNQLVLLARPLKVTFHRAFDMTCDLFRALEDVCVTGADRILTSGGEQTALQGVETIASLVEKARGRIIVIPGSGIKPDNARDIVSRTGVAEVHVGLRSRAPSPMMFRNPRIRMGSAEGVEYERFGVLEEDVRKLRVALAAE